MTNGWPTSLVWGGGSFLGCAAVGVIVAATRAPAQPPAAPVKAERAAVAIRPVDAQDVAKKRLDEIISRILAYPVTLHAESKVAHASPGFLRVKIGSPNVAAAGDDTTAAISSDAGAGELTIQVSDAGLRKGLRRFSARVGAEPRDARLTKVNGHFQTSPPRPGKELDYAGLAQALQTALDDPTFRTRIESSIDTDKVRSKWLKTQTPLELTVNTRVAQPHVTLEHLKGITGPIASFSTGLGGSSRNRVHNITLACKAIDGTVLRPGDVFSYNDVVGPRVPSAGFKEAPVIIQGELQPGTGGGICQVSSTLYNTALMAGLQIVRRSHHAFPVHYLPAGRDATVVDGAVDFRFKNNLPHAVAIDAKVVGRRVVFNLYGDPADKQEVEIQSSRITRIRARTKTISDSRLAKGRRITEKPAMDGRRVTITRVFKKDGAVVKREVVSSDYYRPFDRVVRVGTRVVSRPSTTPKTRDTPSEGPTAAPATTPAARGTDPRPAVPTATPG